MSEVGLAKLFIMIVIDDSTKKFGERPKNLESDPNTQQLYSYTCAVKSQEIILREFGIEVTEEQLRQEGFAHGWLSENGTPLCDVGKLMELHGVPVTHTYHANIFNMVNELSKGHKVMVSVDAGELWGEERFTPEDNNPDHTLIVSGVDTSDVENVKVIITDPGTGDFRKEYSMEEFVEAWKDSDCCMISTNNAAPGVFEPFNDVNNFVEPVTNLPSIGEMPFDVFSDTFSPLCDYQFIPPYVTDDFSHFVNGDINDFSLFSPDTLDLFSSYNFL